MSYGHCTSCVWVCRRACNSLNDRQLSEINQVVFWQQNHHRGGAACQTKIFLRISNVFCFKYVVRVYSICCCNFALQIFYFLFYFFLFLGCALNRSASCCCPWWQHPENLKLLRHSVTHTYICTYANWHIWLDFWVFRIVFAYCLLLLIVTSSPVFDNIINCYCNMLLVDLLLLIYISFVCSTCDIVGIVAVIVIVQHGHYRAAQWYFGVKNYKKNCKVFQKYRRLFRKKFEKYYKERGTFFLSTTEILIATLLTIHRHFRH